ncbi:hypothetical protein [Pedobacter frigoris]|uniref:hypothetical protein n=1 Tax=Pedobacter frigoris TaxID=2571272 RepID=UPI002930A47A|nr:hypothetical protein [Pedobacter frigoris]
MKQVLSLLLFLFVGTATNIYAQSQDYKVLLGTFCLNARNNFADIKGEQTDTTSVFYPSKLKADVGEVKIGIFPNTATLNWITPLAQSKGVQVAVKEFIKVKFADLKLYKTVSDGTEEEGDITTNVYGLGANKPLLVFQTIYYRNSEEAGKSNFTIIIYGK